MPQQTILQVLEPYAGNPCIPFGPPGSYDAGTAAIWVYEYHVYTILAIQ